MGVVRILHIRLTPHEIKTKTYKNRPRPLRMHNGNINTNPVLVVTPAMLAISQVPAIRLFTCGY